MATTKIHYVPKSEESWSVVNQNNEELYTAEWYDNWDEYESDEIDDKFCENCQEFQGNTRTPMKLLRIENTATLFAAQFGHFCADCSTNKKAVETFIEMALTKMPKE